MITDIDALHAQGKKVLLSIGGATAYIYLNSTTERDAFVSSVSNIMAAYSYKIDGIDLDLEKNINTGQNSMAFGSTWTMSAPAAQQTHMINAVKSIMSNYQTQTSKKMLLTAAPEAVYLMGALSSWQITNANGGAFLPILDGLRNEIDCLHMQLYNAGGSSGGIVAWNNTIYYDNGGIEFALAMNESMIKGFTLLSGKGTFASFPASKLAMGFPATSAPNAAGTGYVTPTNVCNAARYFKGEIAKPSGCTYTMSASYPTLKGLMTWSINEDSYASYPFAGAYTCAFSSTAAPVANFTKSLTTACVGQTVTFTDASTNSPTSWSWNFGSGASTAKASTQGAHNISYSTTGTKTIALTATNGGGSNATSQTITVVAASGNAGAITGNTSVCQTSSQTYSISAVAGASTYTWTVPTGSTITSGQGTTSITVTIGGTAGNITVTPSNSCSSGTAATKAITISPAPNASGSITGSTSVCANTTNLNYSISPVTNATGYTWTVPAGASIVSGQGTTAIVVNMGSTSGNVGVTPTNTCGNGTAASVAVTVNGAGSAAGSISGNASVCANASGLIYSISSVAGASSYTWTVPSGASITAGQGRTSITVTMGSTGGNITVTPISTCGNGAAATLAVSTSGGSTPLVEGFETSVPPSNWTLNNADNGTTWSRTTTAYASGTASAKMTFFGYTTNLGGKDELQTQAISFVGKTNHSLTFKHAYAWMDRAGTANDRRDSLQILISTNCGSTWTQLFYKGGNTLSTLTNGAGQQAAFTPTSGQWVNNTIDLSAYDGQSGVIIKFVAINRNGNNLYLDDINISGTTAVAPVANFTSDKTTVCAGGTVTFTNSSTNSPTSYSWDFGTGASPATATGVGPHTVTYATTGTATVALTVSNTAGSNTNTKTNLITVNPLPSAAGSISGGASVCGGTTGNVYSIGSVANATSYTWTVPTGSTITAGQGTTSITVTFGSTSGNITVTPTNSCGNGTAATVPITITPSVTPSVLVAATQTTICAGTNVTFTATPTNGGSTPSYQWKLNNNDVGTNSTSYSNASLANNDVVTVVMTSNATCATSSTATAINTTITVTTVVVPSVSIVSSKDTICAGASVTYTATPVNGGTTPAYAWKVNGNPAGTNSATFTSSTLANGDVITVVLTTNAACASPTSIPSNSKTITVNAIQTTGVSVVADTNNVCAGTNITFTATPSNGGTAPSYQWKLNNNNVGTNSDTYSNSSLANGDVVKVVMTSDLTCVNSATATSNSVTMTINPLLTPSVSISVNDSTVCAGNNVIFTATPTNGGTASYAWKLNGNPTGSNSTNYSSTSFADNDVVSVVMTSTETCKTSSTANSNSIKVAVNPMVNASVSIAESQNNICSGTSVTFTATPTNEGSAPSYVWKLNNNAVGGNSNTFSTSSLANSDVVLVELTSNEMCVNSATVNSNSITMIVNPVLVPSVSISVNDSIVCAGDNVVFTATPVNGGNASYQWKLNGNNVGSNSDSYSSTSFNNNDVVSVELSSDATCATPTTANSNAISVEVNTIPNQPSAITGDATICLGASNQVYSVSAVPNVTYKWSFSGDGALISETSNTLTKSFLTTHTGDLEVSAENECGRSSTSLLNIIIEDVASQPGYFVDSTTTVNQGETGVLFSVPHVIGVTYNWSFDGGPITVTTNGQNAVSIDFDATVVSGNLSVTATNNCGTSAARTMPITVNIITGIEEKEKAFAASLYPNPFIDNANIIVQLENEENVNISVRDVQGKEMFVLLSSSTLSAGKHTFALPNNLAPGTYIINIQSDKGSQNIKAIKIN